MKPVIKWAGGKRQLLNEIRRRMPCAYKRYYEPFLGGGAVLFALAPVGAVVGDNNVALINVYNQIKSAPERVLEAYQTLEREPATKELYTKRRRLFNLTGGDDTVARAALFMWINRHCFNGLFRQNKKGLFNTSYGGQLRTELIDVDNLRRVARYLASITIHAVDYEQTCATARAGDFVYIDPPYVDTERGAYGAHWQTADHERLAAFCRTLNRKGVLFMLSNNNTPVAWTLYRDFRIETVSAAWRICSDGRKRGKTAREIIVTNYSPPMLIENEVFDKFDKEEER